jgi:hypothetical protein
MVLEGQPAPFNSRLLSTDESEAEAWAGVLAAAMLAEHHKDEIRVAARHGLMREFHDDVDHLARALRTIADLFTHWTDKTLELHTYIEKSQSAAQADVRGRNT